MAELDFVAIRARAQYAKDKAEYSTSDCLCDQIYGQEAADVLALLDYLDAYEKALKPLRGKTFTYIPGLEILNTVTGPTREQLLEYIAELEARLKSAREGDE